MRALCVCVCGRCRLPFGSNCNFHFLERDLRLPPPVVVVFNVVVVVDIVVVIFNLLNSGVRVNCVCVKGDQRAISSRYLR